MNNSISRARYKAKRLYGGEWVYGCLVLLGGDAAIFQLSDGGVYFNPEVMVDTATVCQFTGLKDIKGNDIYDGDIVSSDYYIDLEMDIVLAKVEFMTEDNNARFGFKSMEQDAFIYGNIEVVGNIFDNPELLESS